MELQTKIPLRKQPHNLIDYNSDVLLFGSCFVENIGKKFDYFKFRNLQNPFGILFQPLAIEALITNAVNEKVYTEEDLFYYNELWHCFEAHSSLNETSKERIVSNLNENCKLTSKGIHNATHIIITLGTSWVYRYIETDSIVANCHKVPQKKFLKELLSVDQIMESLNSSIALIKSLNPSVTCLITVSPVRHLKDGFIENSKSKAHLISAVQEVVEPRQNIHYFPAYEIVMDELRDYRFYTEDMVHPNQIAMNYIWDCFQNVWINQEALSTMKSVDEIQKSLQHKPFNSASDQHQLFLSQLAKKQRLVKQKYPHIVF